MTSRLGRGGLLARTLTLVRPRWPMVALAALLLVMTTATALAGPWILRYAVDEGLVEGRPDTGVVTRAGLLYLGLALAGLVLSRLQVELVGRIGEWFVRELRSRTVDHVMSMSVRYFDRTPAGVLVSRMTADVDALQDAVQLGVVPFTQAVLTLVFLVAVLVALSWQLALVCVLPAAALVAATVWFRRASRSAFAQVRDRVADTVTELTERLAGLRVVRAFRQEARTTASLRGRSRRQLGANVTAVRIQSVYLTAMELATVGSIAAVLAAGGALAARDAVSVGTLSAFVLYLLLAFEPVQSLSFLVTLLESAAAALRKIYGLLDEPVDLRDATQDELAGALASVGAGSWLDSLPDGLATQVGEGGSLLSAGERQLVALARVCLLGADVVVLDEATSGLDPGTEKLVEAAVIAATADRAVLVVAHRMSTARGADRVVVVDTGVTEIGTHDELLARGGRYAALFTAFENPARSEASPAR
ncbi:ABC transporter ATP-binding protein [Frankia sp. QA3]|uniref:ABC transporter ATP-binding protein n=1 Tax=Frankia sp. QA3 TaxID=710111 RepID=UPI000269C2BD|nr:ABC transporter ATP-binding protein [Frankia sp. QA3]EIV91043.1 ABC-type multidrug transport system, ATPase and permease component [Frankia sp. QA3]